ncbi:Fc.00g020310.m01.CDS01 [Cosmosporella sp. VM-42]
MAILRSLLLAATVVLTALAVTPVSDSDMTNLLNEGGVSLAMKAQPMWFFGQAMNQPPCIPAWATTSDGKQTPSAALCGWPNTGCNCKVPGVGIGNPSPDFPVYYTYAKCNGNEVRVAYNLFYEKDGFTPDGTFGHRYDWERVVVIWGKSDDGNWRQSKLLLSQHSGYDTQTWAGIQNTFNDADAALARGGGNGRTNLDHPKVYVAWSKHANYEDRNTGWNDALSQLTDNAFRSQDWWSYTKRENFIRADTSTDIGRLIGGFNWGDATSNPAHVHESLCSAS